ncbi:MAG: NAD(P)-binding domain-containing protein [Candidatus Lambdaproteobacteria bacterium]|nr:NAD(P)-binding domain-containing protein [Candidatus Lambdaproteobacteria bacterium]
MARAARSVGVLGSGVVGQTLADGFLARGYRVMRGSRDPAKLADWRRAAGANAATGNFEETAAFGEVAVLAVKGTAALQAVRLCGAALDGKVVLDTTNPIADAPPVHGVLQFFVGTSDSLLEQLQKQAPKVRFVKAFSCVGHPLMVNPDFGGSTPTMFICGNDAAAKARTTEILTEFGWETEDMGAIEAARAIEPLCMLWCIPGLSQNRWSHAFKLLKR